MWVRAICKGRLLDLMLSFIAFRLDWLCYGESFFDIKTKMKNLFDQILDKKNLQGAYLDLVEKFDIEGKSAKYAGIDGVKLNDLNCTSAELLEEVLYELENYTPLLPALEYEIAKKDGGGRIIYVYAVKDRIKAQAISRVLQPIFEEIYSPFLFSYRSSQPSYYAAKTIAKRYKKNYGQDTIFQADISEYTENINKSILEQKLKETGLSSGVLRLLRLFMTNSILRDNEVVYPSKGVIQGVPLMTFFANLYLNDLDKVVGKKVALYRRVGDDFIVFDKDKGKVEMVREMILNEAKSLGLTISEKKTQLINSSESFKFLGYVFSNKTVSIKDSSINRALIRWKRKLKFYPIEDSEKISRLNNLLFKDPDCIHNEFVQFVSSYRQANDFEQIKDVFSNFLHILTKFFFGKYSSKNQRIMQEKLLAKVKVPSLYKYFIDFHNGKKTIAELSLSKKR